MPIVDDDIERVRSATDVLAVIGEYVSLRQVGRRYVGLCPFHTEKTPSFNVNAEEGRYYCFGCQERGDIFAFVMAQEHCDFPAAVERLAGKVGISLTYTNAGEGEGRREKKRISKVVADAEEWYHQRLLTAPDAAAARSYLRNRGFDGESVREWHLGWAPDAWDELAKGLRLSSKDALDSGLGKRSKRGSIIDHFRGRVLFPIHDPQGAPIGFGGRIMPGQDGPKYINTGQTALYDKSSVLFALDKAKAEIVRADEVIVCEGYTDVIAFFRVGLPRAVATCGTALTDDHVTLLRRFARRIVLAFDADKAGQAAADRFYQWEQKHDLDVVVASLPAGVDPADLADDDPDALREAVEQARPFLEFRLNRILDNADLTTPEQRARTAEAAVAVVAEHPNDLVRDQYVMTVAGRCRVDADKLRERVEQARRRPRPSSPPSGDRGRAPSPPARRGPGWDEPPDEDSYDSGWGDEEAPPGDGPPRVRQPPATAATEVLRLAVHRPETVVDWLDGCLFDDPVHAEAYEALIDASTVHDAIESSAPDVSAFLSRLAVEDPVDDPLDPVLLVLKTAGQRALADAKAADEPDLGRITGIARLVGRLSATDDGVSAARELLALVSHGGTTE